MIESALTLSMGCLAAGSLCAATLCWLGVHCATKLLGQSLAETQISWSYRLLCFIPLLGDKIKRIAALSKELKQSELDHQTRYKILTENVAAAVLLHQADGTVLWGSPFTEVLTGFALSEIYKNRAEFFRSQVHEEDRELVERSLAIVGTGEPFQYRYRFYHKSGMPLWLETRTVPIFDNSLNGYIALSITLDVTANVLNQIQIEEQNRDLNEFTYMLSHDLKNPICTIKGLIGILQGSPVINGASVLSDATNYMAKAAARLEQLVSGVLELARVSATERSLEPIRLGEIVSEVVEEYKQQLDQSSAKVTTLAELPYVLGNRTQLYQVFSNLIGNAIKYRIPDRPLIISIAPEKASSRRRASVSVRDNGRGISPKNLDLVFKPFNRAGESAIDGSGVGLACVHRLVGKLGGSIDVESAEGCGTAFTLELRRAPESST